MKKTLAKNTSVCLDWDTGGWSTPVAGPPQATFKKTNWRSTLADRPLCDCSWMLLFLFWILLCSTTALPAAPGKRFSMFLLIFFRLIVFFYSVSISIFFFLTSVFRTFSSNFTTSVFIYGAGYNKKWDNVATVKFYNWRGKKGCLSVQTDLTGTDAMTAWCRNVRLRQQLDFSFYNAMRDFNNFLRLWCYKNTLCQNVNDRLFFSNAWKESALFLFDLFFRFILNNG